MNTELIRTRRIINAEFVGVNKKIVVSVFVLLLPFFCPSYFLAISDFSKNIIYICRFASFFYLLIKYIFSKSRISIPIMLCVIFQLWILFITFFKNRIEFNACLMITLSGTGVLLLIEVFKKHEKELLLGLLLLFETLIYSNLFFIWFDILPHYDGYQCFLGSENSLILFFLPGLLISFIYFVNNKNYFRFILFASVLLVSVIKVWAATTVVALLASLLFFLFFIKIKRRIRTRTIWLATILFVIILVFFSNLLINNSLYQWFTIQFLGKDATLSQRFAVWDTALKMIKSSPLVGHGYNAHLIMGIDDFASHAHNFYLELFIVGGAIYFCLFVIFLLSALKKVDKYNNKSLQLVFSSVFLAMFITFMTESYSEVWKYYLIFAMALNIEKFDFQSLRINSKKVF